MAAYQQEAPEYPCVCQHDPATHQPGDYCELINIGDGRSICEYHQGSLDYWISILADETPIVLCALEKYLGHAMPGSRKTDGLGAGWDQKGCAHVVFIELRRMLLNEAQWEDKLDQVRQTMELLCKTESDVGRSYHQNVRDVFAQACDPMGEHKIAGVIIPIDRSRKRAEQSATFRLGDKEAIIVALPFTFLKRRILKWSELLTAIGV